MSHGHCVFLFWPEPWENKRLDQVTTSYSVWHFYYLSHAMPWPFCWNTTLSLWTVFPYMNISDVMFQPGFLKLWTLAKAISGLSLYCFNQSVIPRQIKKILLIWKTKTHHKVHLATAWSFQSYLMSFIGTVPVELFTFTFLSNLAEELNLSSNKTFQEIICNLDFLWSSFYKYVRITFDWIKWWQIQW